jgi:hypothetical protein
LRDRIARAIALLSLLGGASALANPVFVGDFEAGNLDQYSAIDVHPGTTDRLTVVTDPVREGNYALKATVQPGDYVKLGARAELVVTSPMFHEGEERWFHWHTLFPQDFQTSPRWHLFIQWHSGDFGVPLQFNLHGERLSFRVMGHQYDAQGQHDAGMLWTAPLQRGEWMEFLLRVKFSADPKIGYVELWKDGEKVVTQTFHQTLYAGGSVYLKQGLYRDRSIDWPQSIYHDGLTIYAQRPDHVLQPPAVAEPSEPSEPADTSDPALAGTAPFDPSGIALREGEELGCGQANIAGALYPFAALGLLPLLGRLRRRR